jgi:hypothetical protein
MNSTLQFLKINYITLEFLAVAFPDAFPADTKSKGRFCLENIKLQWNTDEIINFGAIHYPNPPSPDLETL